jgi:hypothetical protein
MKQRKDAGFVTIRIKDEDHERLTKFVTHTTKIHDVVTRAIDLLEKQNPK